MKINIFFFISNFGLGGAGNAILNFLNKLNKKKYNIHMIYLGKSVYKKYFPNYVKVIQIENSFFFFKTFFSFFKIKKIISEKIKYNKNNLFISNIHYSNILSIIFLRNLNNLKIFLFERTSLKELDIYFSIFSFIKNKFIKILIKNFYKYADCIYSNSLTSKKEFDKIGLKSKVIYSGLITKKLPKKKFKNKKFYKLISVGRLTKQKNYELLINSISQVKFKNYKLYIYGEGEEKEKIKKTILNHKLEKKIHLVPYVKNKNKIYKNADLLIHTALFEGLPNCLVDSINYGVPVIAYNGAGGISEILGKGKYGELIYNQDPYEISLSIDDFFNNPKRLQKKILKSKFMIYKFTNYNTAISLEKEILNIFSNQ